MIFSRLEIEGINDVATLQMFYEQLGHLPALVRNSTIPLPDPLRITLTLAADPRKVGICKHDVEAACDVSDEFKEHMKTVEDNEA